MRKNVLVFAFCVFAFMVSNAQSINDGIKLLHYEKNTSGKQLFEKLYLASPKDPKTIYWYGQAFIENDDVAAAGTLYKKALQDGINDPFIWVGIGQVDLMQGGDFAASKQRFEAAITNSIETKGKNKGKPSAAILNAVGHSFTTGSNKLGDPSYAIEKLKQAETLDLTTANILIDEGLCYIKAGGEYGGEAVKAFLNGAARDTKDPLALYRIGRIYLSQNNKELFEKYFNDVIALDANFPPVYLTFFNYYSDKDVNKAKSYLDKYISVADADPNNDFYLADYLFRAGKYSESLAKAQEIEAKAGITVVPRINILYAYNYDRLNDSVKAKSFAEKFFATAPANKIQSSDYDLAAKIYSRIPGSEDQLANLIQSAINSDTSVVDKINYIGIVADNYGKSKNAVEQFKWLQKIIPLKATLSEGDFYKLSAAGIAAKDYVNTVVIAKNYLFAFSDKPQPYSFLRKSAIGLDADSTKGLAIEHLNILDSFLEKDTAKNKKALFSNYYYMLLFYGDKVKDYPKALEVLDKMLILYPIPGEENKFASEQKEMIKKFMNKPPAKTSKPAGTKPPADTYKK